MTKSNNYEIIDVNFAERRKIQKYVTIDWLCIICAKMFEFDSRNEYNTQRIILRDNLQKRNQECICEECAVNIKSLVDKEGWE